MPQISSFVRIPSNIQNEHWRRYVSAWIMFVFKRLESTTTVIGYTLCFGLMGALAVQYYIYFTRFADEKRTTKAFVTTVFLLETLMTAVAFYGFWISSTTQALSTLDLFIWASWTPMILAPITGLVITLTHGFYCRRLFSLRKSFSIPIIVMLLSLFQFASIIYLVATKNLLPSALHATHTLGFSDLAYLPSHQMSLWLVAWLGSSAVCDLIITICMIATLRPSGAHSRNRLTLVRLTKLSIETGLVTAIATLTELILGIVYKHYMYHIAMFYAISKLYTNCLLASLNFRLDLRHQSDLNLTEIVWNDMNTRPTQSESPPVHVVQDVAHAESEASSRTIEEAPPTQKHQFAEDQGYELHELAAGMGHRHKGYSNDIGTVASTSRLSVQGAVCENE
ncbi:hypothetical protein JVU11DRAFT_9021 [Chiua virens]|nr:hypothetical protein JVU11DRAFT_9021 [Chiua virens]